MQMIEISKGRKFVRADLVKIVCCRPHKQDGCEIYFLDGERETGSMSPDEVAAQFATHPADSGQGEGND